MTNYLDAALKLASRGTRVFPVGADKAPRTPRGFHDATTDPKVISGWDWNGGGMVAACIPDGQVVIDVDPRNGGEETIASLVAAYGPLPATRTVRTLNSGWHYYFTVPAGVELRSTLGPGVDVKRPGKGYVVIPPSKGYKYETPGKATAAPDWLLSELAIEARSSAEGEASKPKFFSFQEGTPYGLSAMDRELGRLGRAQAGERNNSLNRAAFALANLSAGGELPEEKAIEELERVALQIGLSPSEARTTISSGWAKGLQSPRQAPEREETRDTTPSLQSASSSPPGELPTRKWVNWKIEEPPPPFYLHPVIPRNAYVLVFGASGAAKSMTWVGLLAQASHHGFKSSVYSLENSESVERDRIRRFSPIEANFRMSCEPLDLNSNQQLEKLIEEEQEYKTDLILIDSYSMSFNSRSEDGNAKAIEFARRVRWIMHHVGCSVVVIDHTGFVRDDEPRDASAKRQQVDVAILMKEEGNWRQGQPSTWTMDNKKASRFANPFKYTGQVRDTATNGLEIAFIGGGPEWKA